jgi:hypothetical protein
MNKLLLLLLLLSLLSSSSVGDGVELCCPYVPFCQEQGQLHLFTPLVSCCESEDLNVRLCMSDISKMKWLTKEEKILEKTEFGVKCLLFANKAELTHISTACVI